jgi:hypothetical protein
MVVGDDEGFTARGLCCKREQYRVEQVVDVCVRKVTAASFDEKHLSLAHELDRAHNPGHASNAVDIARAQDDDRRSMALEFSRNTLPLGFGQTIRITRRDRRYTLIGVGACIETHGCNRREVKHGSCAASSEYVEYVACASYVDSFKLFVCAPVSDASGEVCRILDRDIAQCLCDCACVGEITRHETMPLGDMSRAGNIEEYGLATGLRETRCETCANEPGCSRDQVTASRGLNGRSSRMFQGSRSIPQ